MDVSKILWILWANRRRPFSLGRHPVRAKNFAPFAPLRFISEYRLFISPRNQLFDLIQFPHQFLDILPYIPLALRVAQQKGGVIGRQDPDTAIGMKLSPQL